MNKLLKLYRLLLRLYYKLQFNRFYEINTIKHSTFHFFVSSTHEHMRFKTFNYKEPEMLDWLSECSHKYGSDNFTFYDIGANVGIYSLFLASINSKCSIFSYEPEATNFASFNKNISINGFKNIKPLPIALSSSDGFFDLHVSIQEAGAGAASLGSDYKYTNNENLIVHKQPVTSARLDSIVKNNYFKFPNFIKIDVDGHEHDLFNGAQEVFSDPRLISMIIEYDYNNLSEKMFFIDKICSFGFRLVLESNWVDKSTLAGVNIQNFIFDRGQQ